MSKEGSEKSAARRPPTNWGPSNWGLTIRRLHTYMGALIAPSVLFVATTGAMQLYHVHESHGDYHAPVMIRSLSAIHQDQTYAPPPEKPDAAAAPGGQARQPSGPAPDEPTPISTTLLKAFDLMVAAGLIVSTLMGVWMAVTFGRRKRLIWALLVLGAVLPIAILAI